MLLESRAQFILIFIMGMPSCSFGTFLGGPCHKTFSLKIDLWCFSGLPKNSCMAKQNGFVNTMN